MEKDECLKIIANCDKARREQRIESEPFSGRYPMLIMAVPEYQYRDMAETIIRLLEERDAIDLKNPPYFTPIHITEYVSGSSGNFKAAIKLLEE